LIWFDTKRIKKERKRAGHLVKKNHGQIKHVTPWLMDQAMKKSLSTPIKNPIHMRSSLHIADQWTVTSPTPLPSLTLVHAHQMSLELSSPKCPWAPTIQVHICSGGKVWVGREREWVLLEEVQ
jgi:hypothetical protein